MKFEEYAHARLTKTIRRANIATGRKVTVRAGRIGLVVDTVASDTAYLVDFDTPRRVGPVIDVTPDEMEPYPADAPSAEGA